MRRNHRIAISLPLWVMLAVGLAQGGTIQYKVTDLEPGTTTQTMGSVPPLKRYTYSVSDLVFLANQELDIVFSAGSYGTLSNGLITSGFNLILLQPNNPPGAPGHFSAFIDQVAHGGAWSVDFEFIGSGQPGSQAYFINQYNPDGTFDKIVDSGFTSASDTAGAPEPGTFVLASLVFVGGAICWAVRRLSPARRG